MSAWLNQIAKAPDDDTSAPIRLAGAQLIADRSGALYWPEEKLLVVADLHFEKGSSFARFRQHLPPYDTAATLRQLRSVLDTYQPERVIALGDSVHDRAAWDRLSGPDREDIGTLAGRIRDWFWVAGNHDPDPPSGVPGRAVDSLAIGPLLFRHEPGGSVGDDQAEIAGHLHPAARVIGRGGSTRRPAFAYDTSRLILPAFGAYAGGLCLSAAPFRPLFAKADLRAAVCGRSRVFTVQAKSIHGWR